MRWSKVRREYECKRIMGVLIYHTYFKEGAEKTNNTITNTTSNVVGNNNILREDNTFTAFLGEGVGLTGIYNLSEKIDCIIKTYWAEAGGIPEHEASGTISFKKINETILELSEFSKIKTKMANFDEEYNISGEYTDLDLSLENGTQYILEQYVEMTEESYKKYNIGEYQYRISNMIDNNDGTITIKGRVYKEKDGTRLVDEGIATYIGTDIYMKINVDENTSTESGLGNISLKEYLKSYHENDETKDEITTRTYHEELVFEDGKCTLIKFTSI